MVGLVGGLVVTTPPDVVPTLPRPPGSGRMDLTTMSHHLTKEELDEQFEQFMKEVNTSQRS